MSTQANRVPNDWSEPMNLDQFRDWIAVQRTVERRERDTAKTDATFDGLRGLLGYDVRPIALSSPSTPIASPDASGTPSRPLGSEAHKVTETAAGLTRLLGSEAWRVPERGQT